MLQSLATLIHRAFYLTGQTTDYLLQAGVAKGVGDGVGERKKGRERGRVG